jgi:hypothetical protein
MTSKSFAVLGALGALAVSGSARADLVKFSLFGDGNVTVTGTLTTGPDPYADTMGIYGTPANVSSVPGNAPNFQSAYDPPNALAVTAVTGTFSDVALGISNETITKIVGTNPQRHFAPDYTIPYSFSWYPAPNDVSYDNLFYENAAAPLTCLPTPSEPTAPGGFFDDYGVFFELGNGDYVDIYSNGGSAPNGAIYGAVVWTPNGANYDSSAGLIFAVPEPSTWAMMALGFAGLGFAGLGRSRSNMAAA